jgi:Uncharacterised protein family (UPF0158)
MSEHKRRLKVNLDDLKFAFDSGSAEIWHYLDLATGEVVEVTEETRQQLEALMESTEAETIEALNEAIQNEDVPDWQKEVLHDAALVEFEYDSRFMRIPQAESREGYEDMEAFIETVSDQHLQELLWVAIRGKGAFRRFKDVLAAYPQERERWFQFRDERLQRRALDWLEDEGINPAD